MKSLLRCLTALAVLGSAGFVQGKTLDDYVQEAEKHQKSGYLQEAAKTMEKAVGEYPASPEAHSYLGLYLGMQAGQTNDMMEVMELVNRSFQMLDKAVSLDADNPTARFYRGLMGVKVPEFFGKLDMAIADLEFVVSTSKRAPGELSAENLVTAYDLLGVGYQKKGALDKARAAYEEVIDLAPGTDLARNAEENINRLARRAKEEQKLAETKPPESAAVQRLKEEIEKHPESADLHLQLGKIYHDEGNYDEAEKALKDAIDLDDTSVAAHKLLAMVLTQKVGVGYNERIYDDTDLRTNLAFEVMGVLDRTVPLAPQDMDLRLWRGVMSVEMPFFVQKLDQGIEDLNMVIESEAPDSIIAEALYWLGMGYRKKTNTSWIEVVTKHPGSQAARLVFDAMDPGVLRFDPSQHTTPLVVVDFVLGFQDELAPQTAIWIEDEQGNFIKTVYVSGFAGYVKERQITLPIWANSSNFMDADGITGASIDIGHHIYFWDLKDYHGKQIKPGQYVVKIEVSHWPSMQYQLAAATVELGKKKTKSILQEGNFIPYLEVTYYPK
jgi:tetratricopeptide (TPR) repeat protein